MKVGDKVVIISSNVEGKITQEGYSADVGIKYEVETMFGIHWYLKSELKAVCKNENEKTTTERFFENSATKDLIELLKTNVLLINNTQNSLTVKSSSAVINEICDELKCRYSVGKDDSND